VQSAIVEADHRDVVPDLAVGEGQLAAGALLAPAIGHVGGVAVEEKMIGVDAAALVAAMADVHARRDGTVPDEPCHPVRPLGAARHAERAVARVVHGAVPDVAA
jgi:hypothetical protein